MILRCLFHIHTRLSPDCLTAPSKVLDLARKAAADILIVTDHETVRGSESVMRIADGNPRFVIRAGEFRSEKGDMIGVFLKDEIRSRKASGMAEEIRSQGGLVVLPHPYKGHRMDDELLKHVDLIETFNARCSPLENQASRKLALRLNRAEIAGSDAHCAAEIRAAFTEFEVNHEPREADLPEIFRTAPRRFRVAPVSRIYQPYSGMIKAWRTRDAMLFGYQLKRLVSVASREIFSA